MLPRKDERRCCQVVLKKRDFFSPFFSHRDSANADHSFLLQGITMYEFSFLFEKFRKLKIQAYFGSFPGKNVPPMKTCNHLFLEFRTFLPGFDFNIFQALKF